jgi:hypothetical protein
LREMLVLQCARAWSFEGEICRFSKAFMESKDIKKISI